MKVLTQKDFSVKGFKAGAISCGIKKKNKKDLAAIFSEKPARISAVFTKNRVKAAPVILSMDRYREGELCQMIIANSGNANACTGKQGMDDARKMLSLGAKIMNIEEKNVYIASTGVIGEKLPIEKIEENISKLPPALKEDAWGFAEDGIMTTDRFRKMVVVSEEISGAPIKIAGICKGAGMIAPDMATMLCFIATDALITKQALDKAFYEANEYSFNRITVDGDMSTNDFAAIMANGEANNKEIVENSDDYEKFYNSLLYVMAELAKMIVKDGEGATKIIKVHVINGRDKEDAKKAAVAISRSNLVKTAFFGEDPNWGRIMAAIGYSGARFDAEKTDIFFNDVMVVKDGISTNQPEVVLKSILKNESINLWVDLKEGEDDHYIYTSDLSLEYVKINSSYRS